MTERINIHELEPESYKAMMGLEKYLNQTGLSKSTEGVDQKSGLPKLTDVPFVLPCIPKMHWSLEKTIDGSLPFPPGGESPLVHRRRESRLAND